MLNNASMELPSRNASDRRKTMPLVNSLDVVTHVDRLPVKEAKYKGIYLYNTDNIYPYKCVEVAAKRSPSLSTALKTYSKFMRGNGFDGGRASDTKVNPVYLNDERLTPFDLLRSICDSKSMLGFALHLQYNALGQIAAITPVRFDSVRRLTLDVEKYVIYHDWQRTVIPIDEMYTLYGYNPDPNIVREQIRESGGLENYTGQLFYWKGSAEIYPLASFDVLLDPSQFEAQALLWELSNVQNGYSSSGIFKYPSNVDNLEESKSVDLKMANLKGAFNAGRIISVPYPPNNPPTGNMFESTAFASADNLYKNQKEDAKKTIYEHYNQPSIINGRADSGMFNAQSMQDAFDFYNGITETDRQDIEIALTDIFSNSIFTEIPLPIEIEPLQFISSSTNNDSNDNGDNNTQ